MAFKRGGGNTSPTHLATQLTTHLSFIHSCNHHHNQGFKKDLPESNFCADIFNSIFATGPAVALIVTLFLDNTVPGSRKERGLHVWQQLDASGADWWEDDHMNRVRALTPTPARTRTACTLHPVMKHLPPLSSNSVHPVCIQALPHAAEAVRIVLENRRLSCVFRFSSL